VQPDDAGPALITRPGRNVLELQTKRDAAVAARCQHRRDAAHSFLIKPPHNAEYSVRLERGREPARLGHAFH
jgi:hypothetical protein